MYIYIYVCIYVKATLGCNYPAASGCIDNSLKPNVTSKREQEKACCSNVIGKYHVAADLSNRHDPSTKTHKYPCGEGKRG